MHIIKANEDIDECAFGERINYNGTEMGNTMCHVGKYDRYDGAIDGTGVVGSN